MKDFLLLRYKKTLPANHWKNENHDGLDALIPSFVLVEELLTSDSPADRRPIRILELLAFDGRLQNPNKFALNASDVGPSVESFLEKPDRFDLWIHLGVHGSTSRRQFRSMISGADPLLTRIGIGVQDQVRCHSFARNFAANLSPTDALASGGADAFKKVAAIFLELPEDRREEMALLISGGGRVAAPTWKIQEVLAAPQGVQSGNGEADRASSRVGSSTGGLWALSERREGRERVDATSKAAFKWSNAAEIFQYIEDGLEDARSPTVLEERETLLSKSLPVGALRLSLAPPRSDGGGISIVGHGLWEDSTALESKEEELFSIREITSNATYLSVSSPFVFCSKSGLCTQWNITSAQTPRKSCNAGHKRHFRTLEKKLANLGGDVVVHSQTPISCSPPVPEGVPLEASQ